MTTIFKSTAVGWSYVVIDDWPESPPLPLPPSWSNMVTVTRKQLFWMSGRRCGKTYALEQLTASLALVDRAKTMPNPRARLSPIMRAIRIGSL